MPLPAPADPETFIPPREPAPAAEPAPPPIPPSSSNPEDNNLFNTRYRSKAMRKFSIGLGDTQAHAEDRGVRPATHMMPADMKSVRRVPFDPAAEARQLRIELDESK